MILGNATLRTVPQSPGVGTRGSFDVDLEISHAEEDRLRSADEGATTEITARVEGGTHLTEAGNVQAKRVYPELECHETYGPVTIVKPTLGRDAPVLRVGGFITLRVG
jgi:hypothetical protein